MALPKQVVMGKIAAGAAGKGMSAVTSSAVKFSSNLASVKTRQWKEASNTFQAIRDIDWDKPQRFFNSFYEFVKQFGIFSEFLTPLMDLFDIFDATIIEANTKEIQAWNEALMGLIPLIKDGVKGIKDFEIAGGKAYNSFAMFIKSIEWLIEVIGEATKELDKLGKSIGEFYGGGGGGKGKGGRRGPKIIGGELLGL